MTADEIRQSFLDFFKSKEHEIVPSASLMPTAPNLLFTNAGMNQFVPYFLGERNASFKRAADTQKCIRAGGKHNDLDDVGFDAYHHTFFEMLGNWSFGDYFKDEAIDWSWELLTKVWGFPKERLYATVYKPGEGDPASFDQEAYDTWKAIFEKEGMDPDKHIINGNKKDNFWMMGETGPCGPCTEIHIDLSPVSENGDLVNMDSPWCIELWNNVFIQFNAKEDGSFEPLAAKHVDTGMGFERIAGIIATTKNFSDFSQPTSNYNSDLFTSIFDKITEMCGQKYGYTLPEGRSGMTSDQQRDMAFRVLADHIRTLSCAIADGILPGSAGRNYVLRRILRRAVMFGRKLQLKPGFFTKLVEPTVKKLGPVFPELIEQEAIITKVIASEEKAFDRTIDRGMQILDKILAENPKQISGEDAFTLYDTYGFPLDLTELIAEDKNVQVDKEGFETAMEKQRQQARDARSVEIIDVASNESAEATEFVGFDSGNLTNFESEIIDIIENDKKYFLITKSTPFYAEMGGQIGDTGTAEINGKCISITNTIKDASGRFLHQLESKADTTGKAKLSVNLNRRQAIQNHHSATHILHWALRKVLGNRVGQAGSLVTDDRLRFDFTHYEQPSKEQLKEIETIANEKILQNLPVKWFEVPFDEKPENCIAFFGEKYGDLVRVVDMGGYSVELCGGCHVKATGEIGLFKIVSESAIAAGTRRLEAVAGQSAYQHISEQGQILADISQQLVCKPNEILQRIQGAQEKQKELELALKALQAKGAQNLATELLGSAKEKDGLKIIAKQVEVANPNAMRELGAKMLNELEEGVVVLAGVFGKKGTLCALCSSGAIAKGLKAGDIVRDLTEKLGGRGGGKPDFAMGGITKFDEVERVLANF